MLDKLLPAIAVCLSVQACAAEPPRRVVYLDGSFLPDELAGIAAALDAWDDATPTAKLSERRVLSHASLIETALRPDPMAIYLVRVVSSTDHDCPNDRRSMAPSSQDGWEASSSIRDHGEEQVTITCFDASVIHAWKFVALHELGHAVGIAHHSEPPSVMSTGQEHPEIDRPSPQDVAEAELAGGSR